MSLLIMVVWDTHKNDRTKYTKRTLQNLLKTVDFSRNRLFISDNGSCEETHILYDWVKGELGDAVTICYNGENLGTAKALNKGLAVRREGEPCIKLDGDIEVHYSGWVEKLKEVIERDPSYGIVGLKRKDLMQSPDTDNLTFKSELKMLPHIAGQRWVIVEEHRDIIGTCTLFNPKLIDAIGYSIQPMEYSFEDTLYGLRSTLAGFKNCFVPWIELDHIDDGANPYTQEKQDMAAKSWQEYQRWHTEYCNGTRDIYYDGK